MNFIGRGALVAVGGMLVAGCAGMGDNDPDSTVGSHLAQPAAGAPPQAAIESDDIAIVGQEVAHAIMDLPAVSGATVPPLVKFDGVTSIVDQPVDTQPYTELLRDRLLLLTRQKLRFVEHTLPPYVPGKHHKSDYKQPVQNLENADYEILAELRGHAESGFLRIQVEFVDTRTNEVLFNALYHIHPEATDQPPQEPSTPGQPPASEPPPPINAPASNIPDTEAPTTKIPPSANAPL